MLVLAQDSPYPFENTLAKWCHQHTSSAGCLLSMLCEKSSRQLQLSRTGAAGAHCGGQLVPHRVHSYHFLQAQSVAFATWPTLVWEACSACERLRVCIWAQLMLRKRRVKLDSCNRMFCCTASGRLCSSEKPAWHGFCCPRQISRLQCTAAAAKGNQPNGTAACGHRCR